MIKFSNANSLTLDNAKFNEYDSLRPRTNTMIDIWLKNPVERNETKESCYYFWIKIFSKYLKIVNAWFTLSITMIE